jgi:hypothetical protein
MGKIPVDAGVLAHDADELADDGRDRACSAEPFIE